MPSPPSKYSSPKSNTPIPLIFSSSPCPMGGGVVERERDPKPSESLLTKWPERSKGNYSTMMHSSSKEDTITVQHMECKLCYGHWRLVTSSLCSRKAWDVHHRCKQKSIKCYVHSRIWHRVERGYGNAFIKHLMQLLTMSSEIIVSFSNEQMKNKHVFKGQLSDFSCSQITACSLKRSSTYSDSRYVDR